MKDIINIKRRNNTIDCKPITALSVRSLVFVSTSEFVELN